MLGIVHGIHEDLACLRRGTHLPVDSRRSRGDDPPRAIQIRLAEFTANNLDIRALDLRPDLRSHDRDSRTCREQRLNLACGDGPATHNHDFAGLEVQEGREHHVHTDAGTFKRDPMTRSKSASDRPICVGFATRSRTTSAVL